MADQFPTSANAYDSLGEAYYKNNQYDWALEHYKKAYELEPENEGVRSMIELLYKGK
ncbi:MAG TPA: tetratricopeptide repeat protein [Saprospiraceae bacterium]|nr:tetratricopeptide repeat protein [Saprospiraceae bacterium]